MLSCENKIETHDLVVMNAHSEQLDMLPFPVLTWDDCEWWEGEIDLAFGANAGLSVHLHDPSVDRTPTQIQSEALRYHLENGERIVSAVLTALQPYYDEMRPRYLEFLGDEAERLMPPVSDSQQLRPLIEFGHVHVHPWAKSGVGYVGLQFGCTWDQEHGLGVLLHRNRVVDIGGAEVSFAWSPSEADPPR